MKNHHTHITAPPGELYWRKSVPAARGAKMLLRTVGGPAVLGAWYGALGQYFTAWCPLPTDSAPEGEEEEESHLLILLLAAP